MIIEDLLARTIKQSVSEAISETAKELKQILPGDGNSVPKTRLISVTDWERYHPWPGTNTLRNYIKFKKQYRFESVVKKVGRKVLIDEAAFFAWVEAENGRQFDGE